MEKLKETFEKREEAREFLEEIAYAYNNECKFFSKFEDWVESRIGDRRYNKKYRSRLHKVLNYLRIKNRGSERIFGIDSLLIEKILDEVAL